MYIFSIALLLFVLPALSAAIGSAVFHRGSFPLLFAEWLVFWGAGVRLFVAGIRQVMQPGFTANVIFKIPGTETFPIVREVGFANLSMGTLAILTLLRPAWTVPAAVVGGLYYGLAGLGHFGSKHRNTKENTALLTDLWAFLVLAAFVVWSLR